MSEASAATATLELIQGDITEQRVDAIVTAANTGLRGGGGVDGAVHRAAGPQLLKACREIGSCPTGSAVISPSFDLESRGVKHIIHAVGPVWQDGNADEEDMLASVYRTCLELAERAAVRTIAFPSVSTGIYGFPVELAASIAIRETRGFLSEDPSNIERVVFVLFDEDTYAAFERALDAAEET